MKSALKTLLVIITAAAILLGSQTVVLAEGAAPQPVSFNPADGAQDVSVNIHPSIKFNEGVTLSGGCHLYHKETNTEVPCGVNANGDTLVFTPSEPLVYGTEYYILVSGSSVSNSGGIFFAGITGSSDWAFTTEVIPMTTPTPMPTPTPQPTNAQPTNAQPTTVPTPSITPTPELTPTPAPALTPTMTPALTPTPTPSSSAGSVQQFGLTDGTTYDLQTLTMMLQQQRANELDNQITEAACVLRDLYNEQKVLNNILSALKNGDSLAEEDIGKLVEMGVITESERALCNDAGFKATLTNRIETKLEELDASIQTNTVRLQSLIDKRNQVYETMVNVAISTQSGSVNMIGNMRSEPKYAMTDESGYMLFHDMEFGEHTFALFDQNGEWIAGVKLRLENDTSRPASDQWIQEADGTWVFNVSGNTAIAMFDIDLIEQADGSKTIVFTGGTAIALPEASPVVWPYIAGGAVLLLSVAVCVLLFRKRKRKAAGI